MNNNKYLETFFIPVVNFFAYAGAYRFVLLTLDSITGAYRYLFFTIPIATDAHR